MGRGQPKSEVADVPLDVFKLVWLAFYSATWQLNHEGRAAATDVPVIVHEVMKTGFSDGPAQIVPVFIATSLKSHDEVERAMGCLAYAGRNHSGVPFRLGRSDVAFMGVRREKLDQARRRYRITH